MRFVRLRPLHVLAASLVLAALTAQADIVTISVDKFTIGAKVDVTGSGLSAAPRAALVSTTTAKRYPVRVLSTPKPKDGSFRFEVLSGEIGDVKLEVTPKGSTTPFELGGLTFPKPRITGISPATLTPGSAATLTGFYFGTKTKQCKVLLGGKPAAGLVWNTKANTVRFKVPKVSGLVDVQIFTAVGASDVMPGALAVTPRVTGKVHVTVDIGGRKFTHTDEADIRATIYHRTPKLAEVGFYVTVPRRNKQEGRTAFSLSGKVPDPSLLPFTVPADGDHAGDVFLQYDRAGLDDHNETTLDVLDIYNAKQDITIRITGIDHRSHKVSGNFSGVLHPTPEVAGTLGSSPLCKGDFVVSLDSDE